MLDDAVATQDTVTQLVSAIRRVRRWSRSRGGRRVAAMITTRAGKPAFAWDDPIAKAALVTGWSTTRWRSSPRSTDVALDGEQADAVGLLALVAGQDVEPGDDDGHVADRAAGRARTG